jgi:hypothetical protein
VYTRRDKIGERDCIGSVTCSGRKKAGQSWSAFFNFGRRIGFSNGGLG